MMTLIRVGKIAYLDRFTRSGGSAEAQPFGCMRPWRSCAIAQSPSPLAPACSGPWKTAKFAFARYPVLFQGAGKQKPLEAVLSIALISLRKFGAGEGIRTLDPNLGKVVLYP